MSKTLLDGSNRWSEKGLCDFLEARNSGMDNLMMLLGTETAI